jgi:hypothetical protein
MCLWGCRVVRNRQQLMTIVRDLESRIMGRLAPGQHAVHLVSGSRPFPLANPFVWDGGTISGAPFCVNLIIPNPFPSPVTSSAITVSALQETRLKNCFATLLLAHYSRRWRWKDFHAKFICANLMVVLRAAKFIACWMAE